MRLQISCYNCVWCVYKTYNLCIINCTMGRIYTHNYVYVSSHMVGMKYSYIIMCLHACSNEVQYNYVC